MTIYKNNKTGIIRMLLIAFAFSLGSCAQKIVFQTSSVVPAATGKVKIKKDNNQNYSIDLSIEDLAAANRLNPPGDVYLVWITTRNNGIKNIGQITPSGSLFSSKLRASLKAVTPFKPTRVFITAENRNDVVYPGSREILTTRDF